MAQRTIFRVSSPLGYVVVLTRNRWREIIRFKHPAVAKCQDEARQCVSQPDVIRSSAKNPNVHLYYLQLKTQQYLCVVIAPGQSEERFVVTAYLTTRLKEGDVLWKR